MPPHQYQIRMPPRRNQAHQRKARRHIRIHPLQPRRVDMPLQVIKPDKRQLVGIREPLGGIHADKQRPRQARPMRNRHAIQLARLHPGVRQRLPHHRRHSQHMLPRRHFRHNPPIPRVQRRLRRHHIGTNNAPILNHRRRRLIARRLNPQYLHLPLPPLPASSRPASSPNPKPSSSHTEFATLNRGLPSITSSLTPCTSPAVMSSRCS